MKKKEVELYLKETYEAIKATPGVKSIARLFSSKIAKGERQIISSKQKNSSENKEKTKDSNISNENIINIYPTTTEDNTLNNFYSLSEYDQLKIEEEAITMCSSKESVDEKFLLGMKRTSTTLYYSTLKKYIKVVLENKGLFKAI